jgi:Rad3-related DNA helicase
MNVLEQILNRHKDQRGIIHSVSFNFAKDIQKHLSLENRKRLLMYSTTYEKEIQVKKLESTKNGILIGPSLIEGLNLENDLARFCVFGKVPYPYLGDELVAKKLKYFPTEYSYETSLAIQQGIGRIIRNDEDFGITYLLDASFYDYFNRNASYFPKEFIERLKFM